MILEWGPWQAWTVNSAGEKRRLRYQVARQASQESSTSPPVLDPNIPFQPREGERTEDAQSSSVIFTMFRSEVCREELQWEEMLYSRAALWGGRGRL